MVISMSNTTCTGFYGSWNNSVSLCLGVCLQINDWYACLDYYDCFVLDLFYSTYDRHGPLQISNHTYFESQSAHYMPRIILIYPFPDLVAFSHISISPRRIYSHIMIEHIRTLIVVWPTNLELIKSA